MDNEVSTTRSDIGFKGKSTKFWLQLPEEVLSLIATHYLYILAEQSYCPTTWDNRKLWYSRMAYTCIRDALDIERHISSICPEWRRGMEKHPFWSQVANVIDPNDLLIDKMIFYPKLPSNGSSNAKSSPIYLSPYRHLRNILTGACVICRINHPMSNIGLDAAKRIVYSPMLGYISACNDHAKHKTDYCGLCLREAPPIHSQDTTSRDYDMVQNIGIYENGDDETWPNTKHTCRRCRLEYLVRTASYNPRDREALGGPNLQCADWEVRYKIERFVEYAEGKIGCVIVTAREKAWFRANTKYESLVQHAAAQRMLPRSEGRGAEGRERKESLLTESNQARSWALLDWARQRVLDGHWVIPVDQWYESNVPGQPSVVGTVHPCPWARAADGIETFSDDDVHPSERTINAEIPPTFALCKEVSITFVEQLRDVLAPAMKNIVRKIIMECSVETDQGYEIPSEKARKMTLEDVLTLLREEEGVWYDGVDWVEKRKNENDHKSNTQVSEVVSKVDEPDLQKEDDSDSTTSSSSSGNDSGKLSAHGSSNATSPVLSTSTLQTTPSPPPIIEEITQKKDRATSQQRTYSSYPRMIPVDPVKYPPRLLKKIPYVPVTLAHMPFDSLEIFRDTWRNACAPLYQCNCTVCERAKAEDLNARAAMAATNSEPAPVFPATRYDGLEIELQEAIGDLDGEGEEEVEYEASDMDYDDDDDDEYDEDDDGAYCYSPDIGVMELIQQAPPCRKRSSDELEDSHYSEIIMVEDRTTSSDSLSSLQGSDLRELERTPPKRPRLDDYKDHHLTVAQKDAPLPQKAPQKKRSSEELEDDEGLINQHVTTNKRVRVGEDKPFLQNLSPETLSHGSLDDQACFLKDKAPFVTRDRTIKTEGVLTPDMETFIALEDSQK